MVGHSAAASELSRTAGSQALHELGDDVFGVGPTGAEEASQLVASAFGDGLAVDEDLELSFVTRLDGHVDIKALFDDGGETRRAFLVASSGAVTDLDVHDASKGVGVSDATAFITDGVTVVPTYKKPFDVLAKRPPDDEWRSQRELIRTASDVVAVLMAA